MERTQAQYDMVLEAELKHAIQCMRDQQLSPPRVRELRAMVDRLPEGLTLDEKRVMLHVFSHDVPEDEAAMTSVTSIRDTIYSLGLEMLKVQAFAQLMQMLQSAMGQPQGETPRPKRIGFQSDTIGHG